MLAALALVLALQDPPAPDDPLPKGAVARLGTLRFRCAQALQQLAWSADGKCLGWGGSNGVGTFDAGTGRSLSAGRALGQAVAARSVADGRLLVLVSLGWSSSAGAIARDGTKFAAPRMDGSIGIVETSSGRELQSLPGHGDGHVAFAFAPDGATLVSTGADGKIRVRRVADGTEVHALAADGPATSLDLSSDGRTLVVGAGRGEPQMWDLKEGRLVRKLAGPGDSTYRVAITPDATRAVTSSADGLELWDAATGRRTRKLDTHSPWSVSVSPDGATLAVAAHHAVRLYDLATVSPRPRRRRTRRWCGGSDSSRTDASFRAATTARCSRGTRRQDADRT